MGCCYKWILCGDISNFHFTMHEPMGRGCKWLMYYNDSVEIYQTYTFLQTHGSWLQMIDIYYNYSIKIYQTSTFPRTHGSWLQMTDVQQLFCGDISNFHSPMNPWVVAANDWLNTITLQRFIKLPLSHEPMGRSFKLMMHYCYSVEIYQPHFPDNPWVVDANDWCITMTLWIYIQLPTCHELMGHGSKCLVYYKYRRYPYLSQWEWMTL